MSDKKMIIRNCPCYAKGIFCKGGDIIDDGCADYTLDKDSLICCADRTDCVMKQIVELLKNIDCPCCYKGDGCDNCTTAGQKELAKKILQLLQIEEVE